jgi:hypothetical protein
VWILDIDEVFLMPDPSFNKLISGLLVVESYGFRERCYLVQQMSVLAKVGDLE